MQDHWNRYFIKNNTFELRFCHVFIFILLGSIILGSNILAQFMFPTQHILPITVVTLVKILGVIILLYTSGRLLRKSNLSDEGLGLKLSADSFFKFMFGALVGIVTMVLIMSLLYLFVPYQFTKGSIGISSVFLDANAYFWGNLIEELLFRGYPLIVLSQLLGWRKAVWIMALSFGLFHLPELGFTEEGMKMVLTTASCSFIFSYMFILTGTLWASLGTHVIANLILQPIFGLDGKEQSVFVPVFDTEWPSFDAGFLSFEIATACVAISLYIWIKFRFNKKVNKLEMGPL